MVTIILPWVRDRVHARLWVDIDESMPELENRIRTVAHVATSEDGLRLVLGHMLSADYAITIHENVGGWTSVRLTRRHPDA